MSKKIDSALKDLIKALRKHAHTVDRPRISIKQTAHASAQLQAAAHAYTHAVYSKTRLGTPFSHIIEPELEAEILRSLAAERDAFAARHSES